MQSKNNAKLIGAKFDVLVEGRKRDKLHGRSRSDKLIYLNVLVDRGNLEPLPGQIVQVEIKDSSPWSLESELVTVGSAVIKEKVPVA
ncbi:MAG: TRAM domain-containing protein [Chloroflexi bacterium]|nr:TRAM domain-containing protein [Chloroflexota bacterium]